MPIYNGDKIIGNTRPHYHNNIYDPPWPGVAKLINKLNGLPFDDNDEHHFEVVSNYVRGSHHSNIV